MSLPAKPAAVGSAAAIVLAILVVGCARAPRVDRSSARSFDLPRGEEAWAIHALVERRGELLIAWHGHARDSLDRRSDRATTVTYPAGSSAHGPLDRIRDDRGAPLTAFVFRDTTWLAFRSSPLLLARENGRTRDSTALVSPFRMEQIFDSAVTVLGDSVVIWAACGVEVTGEWEREMRTPVFVTARASSPRGPFEWTAKQYPPQGATLIGVRMAVDRDGRIHVVARPRDAHLQHTSSDDSGRTWSALEPMALWAHPSPSEQFWPPTDFAFAIGSDSAYVAFADSRVRLAASSDFKHWTACRTVSKSGIESAGDPRVSRMQLLSTRRGVALAWVDVRNRRKGKGIQGLISSLPPLSLMSEDFRNDVLYVRSFGRGAPGGELKLTRVEDRVQTISLAEAGGRVWCVWAEELEIEDVTSANRGKMRIRAERLEF
jgi:hypothetical protein